LDEPSDDLDEVAPRLYLIGPMMEPTGSILEMLSVVLDAVDPVGFLLPAETGRDRSIAQNLRDLCADRNTAFLVQDDSDLAKSVSADGVHQSDPNLIASLRATLADDQILGAETRHSRHDAMVAGEEGADYIAFGRLGEPVDQEILDLVSWWREVTVLPSLAFAETPDDVAKLVNAGADFIGISGAVWNDPEGPRAGALRMQAAIQKIQTGSERSG
jgi:thiamine-phosphate pyrophosphorylase